MTIPFIKLQLAGNGFILVDTTMLTEKGNLSGENYGNVARILCDRKYGIGATGTIFLENNNTVRIFSNKGILCNHADDALLCTARYLFDSGKTLGKTIEIRTHTEIFKLDILGAHQFKLSCGSAFSLVDGHVLLPDSLKAVEVIEHEGIRSTYSAIHIHEDVVVAFAQSLGMLDYTSLQHLVQNAFSPKQVQAVIARAYTTDTLMIKTTTKRESSACAAAASVLVAAVCAGITDKQTVVIFEHKISDTQIDSNISKDKDNSRRLACVWDTKENEISVIGSGGYVFEGKFDLAF